MDTRQKLTPSLCRSVDEPGQKESTVVITIGFSQDPDEATKTLSGLGMTVQSSSGGVIVAVASPPAIKEASMLPWVVKLDKPQRLDLKTGFPSR